MTEAEERDAFYQAIMDNWEDDPPRLVYADWLAERGDESSRIRAELIRVQCELARYQREKDIPLASPLRNSRTPPTGCLLSNDWISRLTGKELCWSCSKNDFPLNSTFSVVRRSS